MSKPGRVMSAAHRFSISGSYSDAPRSPFKPCVAICALDLSPEGTDRWKVKETCSKTISVRSKEGYQDHVEAH
jgi:hypothetical protein